MTAPGVPPDMHDFVGSLVAESSAIIRGYYGRPDLRVDEKADASPVTEADRRAEEVMRTLIRKRYPDHGIVGEELGREREEAEFVWVLDPIDGTVSFTMGCPLFGTLIGLLREGHPILGVIHLPILGRLCVGTSRETRLDDAPTRIRPVKQLADAVVLTTDLGNVERHQRWEGFDGLRRKTRLLRTWGDCYGYVLLVSGGADVMLDPIMNPWDLLPLIPIIEGAGGTITGWSGESAVTATSCVAASATIHGDVLAALNA